jgi:tetraacyldisaccharide 4'-kinase
MRAPDFWTVREGRDAAVMLRTLLMPLSWLYAATTARRIARARPVAVGAPVISIGNLTLGGVGKTPIARLARARLAALTGGPCAVVSRGHGGSLRGPVAVDPTRHDFKDVGDEPMMLAADGAVVVARDRAAGARLAVEAGARAIVLDDGHQNPALAKALSIVVVDGETGFGNGFVCPAGPLREPVATGLERADAVVVMGGREDEPVEGLEGFAGPVLRAALRPRDPAGARADIGTGPVLGFCGIGRPEKFDATLRALGLAVREVLPFADHHVYSDADLRRLTALAQEMDATLVTTEKDRARLPAWMARAVKIVPVEARFSDPDAFDALLRTALGAAGEARTREAAHGR